VKLDAKEKDIFQEGKNGKRNSETKELSESEVIAR
jgi:hypothetical protein